MGPGFGTRSRLIGRAAGMEPWALEVLETRADGLCIYPHQLPDTIAWYFERGPLCGSLCLLLAGFKRRRANLLNLGGKADFQGGLLYFTKTPPLPYYGISPRGGASPMV